MKLRRQSGFHSIELIGGLLVLVPIVLYGIDYATVLYGGQMNSSACSAACRAASQGPPTGYAPDANNTPRNRASFTLAKVAQAGAVVRVKRTVRLAENISPPVPAAPYGGPFQGTITVKTRCDVFPPFLLPCVPKNVVLYTEQTYPWSYVMPANYLAATPQSMPRPTGGGPNVWQPPGGAGPLSKAPMQTQSLVQADPGTSTGGSGGASGPTNDLSSPIPDNAP